MKVCVAAEMILREEGIPQVRTGDSRLLHDIAERAGIKPESWKTEKKVLRSLARNPGNLVPALERRTDARMVRVFFLPEQTPAWAQKRA